MALSSTEAIGGRLLKIFAVSSTVFCVNASKQNAPSAESKILAKMTAYV